MVVAERRTSEPEGSLALAPRQHVGTEASKLGTEALAEEES